MTQSQTGQMSSWVERAYQEWHQQCYDEDGLPLGYRRLAEILPIGERRARRLARYVKSRGQRSLGTSILVIGDAHFDPDEPLTRATWLGRMINRIRPEVVVCIGDWADMASLSHWDHGTIRMEGRRYRDDIAASNEALELLEAELKYRPRKIVTLGNHEDRITRAIAHAPHLEGHVALSDFHWEKHGWEVYPFLQPVIVEGVAFCHFFHNRGNQRAISGKHLASNLLGKKHASCVVGHSHLLDFSRDVTGNGQAINGLSVGCYFEANHQWAKQSNDHYWRGICVLRNVQHGDFDLETWSMDRIKREFA